MSWYISRAARKRMPLTTKQAKKGGFYKSNRATSEGRHTTKVRYIINPLKRLQLVIPVMTGFKLKPYIAAGASRFPPETRGETPHFILIASVVTEITASYQTNYNQTVLFLLEGTLVTDKQDALLSTSEPSKHTLVDRPVQVVDQAAWSSWGRWQSQKDLFILHEIITGGSGSGVLDWSPWTCCRQDGARKASSTS
ncbi:hypothetical protein ACA910_011115 [Epithemia clementina (nom. ined.)]